jgi:hypothetical protein
MIALSVSFDVGVPGIEHAPHQKVSRFCAGFRVSATGRGQQNLRDEICDVPPNKTVHNFFEADHRGDRLHGQLLKSIRNK